MAAAKSLIGIPARENGSALLNVVIETPKGSRNKLKYDEKLSLFRLRKVLPLGEAFPYDFGFIPSTRGEDGDPLDVLVLADEALYPGCVVGARLIGVIEAEQSEKGKAAERNDRLIAEVETPVNPAQVRSLAKLGARRLSELEHFFVSYNDAEGRRFEPLARRGPSAAMTLVKKAMRRFARG